MNTPSSTSRCGIDTVEISRVQKLLNDLQPDELARLFSAQELEDAGTGAGCTASLAARFAAKEACCKLFPRETSLGMIGPADFSVCKDGYGAPQIVVSEDARTVMNRHRVATIQVSLTHSETTASAVAVVEMQETKVPWFGKWMYYLMPVRRRAVMENLHRVFGDVLPETEIVRLAQAYYGHLVRFGISCLWRWGRVRIENYEAAIRAFDQGKGVLLLTGHFGHWEAAMTAGLRHIPQCRGIFHLVRRPLNPPWLNELVIRWNRRAGLGTLGKRGSLDDMLQLLSKGAIVVFVFDQHAARRDGVFVDFLGHKAGTSKSLAIIAELTRAPVVPVSCWRDDDGTHVLRFEEALPFIDCEDPGELLRRNTRAYNAALERMLLRHPEQWIWMHKRWKGWV
ncbi:MAG: 4'-phosphopantetheinyl transferase superfamily protein [Verrucomicrobiaceae bacterium]